LREPTIARNYAEALFLAGEHANLTEKYAGLIEALAGALEADPRIRVALESPHIAKPAKQRLLERAFKNVAPDAFVRFLAAVIKRGRQGILRAIAAEYATLVDHKYNRVHARVTLAREPDRQMQKLVTRRLSESLGKEVIAHFRTDPDILGGVIVSVEDRIMDGSLRRRMASLRRVLLGG